MSTRNYAGMHATENVMCIRKSHQKIAYKSLFLLLLSAYDRMRLLLEQNVRVISFVFAAG